ncbi:hypothetical protein APICC_02812 [Apis cerana cerana]|uniref:Uncharacterized protein n=1 Tax=Apis cerana cerana TaxID=94128 RepID=A0A2A3EF47_APICC|nr:hypothetical protein APICC_02812 [Apis cerana cerana]
MFVPCRREIKTTSGDGVATFEKEKRAMSREGKKRNGETSYSDYYEIAEVTPWTRRSSSVICVPLCRRRRYLASLGPALGIASDHREFPPTVDDGEHP